MGRRRSPGKREGTPVHGASEVLDRMFVYGTLRQGQTARSLVANSIVSSVPATIRGRIYAFPMGYPGFVEEPGTVVGELVWLTDLYATFALLDAYEGKDFARVTRMVQPAEGPEVSAWIYVLADQAAVGLGRWIEDGDWVRYWDQAQG